MAGLFRTAVSGFKKSDVLEFIDKQEFDFKTRENELTAKIDELQKKISEQSKALDEHKAEADELLSRNAGLAAELVREGEENASLLARVESLMQELDSRREERLKSESQYEELRRETAIHKQNFEAKAAELAGKNAEIEKLNNTINRITTTQTRISRVMVEAQNTADQIIENAKIQAAALLMKADKKLSNALESAHDFGCEVEALRAKVGDYSGSVETVLKELRDYTGKLGSSVATSAEVCLATAATIADPVPVVEDVKTEIEDKPKPNSGFNFSFDNRRSNINKD